MINPKYQIFISSTFEDLKDERDAVIKAVLEMGHIPIGMELFSAADEEQWETIKRHIDDTDYYIVIVAHKYGSMDGPISYTEKEYDYAISKSIPIIGFVINNNAQWQSSNVDKGQIVDKLDNFKDKIKKKIIKFWENKEDLVTKVVLALNNQISIKPRSGWIKATEAINPEVVNELSRLSKENSFLKEKIEEYKKINEKTLNNDKIIEILKNKKFEFNSIDIENHNKYYFSYYEIFVHIAPFIITDRNQHLLHDKLNSFINSTLKNENSDLNYDIELIFQEFYLLKLTTYTRIEAKLNKFDRYFGNRFELYWKLTDLGKEIYYEIRENAM